MNKLKKNKNKPQKKIIIDRTEYLNIVAIKALAGYDKEYVRKYMDENYIIKSEVLDNAT